MTDEIRTEPLNNACDEIFTAIDTHVSFMNSAEIDEFWERIHSHLYELSRLRIKATQSEKCRACDHSRAEHYAALDGYGCHGIEILSAGDHINPPEFERCHCGEFVKK